MDGHNEDLRGNKRKGTERNQPLSSYSTEQEQTDSYTATDSSSDRNPQQRLSIAELRSLVERQRQSGRVSPSTFTNLLAPFSGLVQSSDAQIGSFSGISNRRRSLTEHSVRPGQSFGHETHQILATDYASLNISQWLQQLQHQQEQQRQQQQQQQLRQLQQQQQRQQQQQTMKMHSPEQLFVGGGINPFPNINDPLVQNLILLLLHEANKNGSPPALQTLLEWSTLAGSLESGNLGVLSSLLNSLLPGLNTTPTSTVDARQERSGSDTSFTVDGKSQDKKPRALAKEDVRVPFRQRQQMLEMSSNDTSSSTSDFLMESNPQQIATPYRHGPRNHYFFPCRSRTAVPDHNSKSAVLRIPSNVKHGQGLVCSHEGCQRKGIKFLYCAVCKTPVAKANFGNRHKHGGKGKSNISTTAAASAGSSGVPSDKIERKNAKLLSSTSDQTTFFASSDASDKPGALPKIISIKQKQQQDDTERSTKKVKSTACSLVGGTEPGWTRSVEKSCQASDSPAKRSEWDESSQDQSDKGSPTSNNFLHKLPNIDWDALKTGGLRRMTTAERMDLWGQMLNSRPSPANSPNSTPIRPVETSVGSSSNDIADSLALAEWLERILWLSDPDNWAPGSPPALAENRTIHEVLEDDGEGCGAEEDKQGTEEAAGASSSTKSYGHHEDTSGN